MAQGLEERLRGGTETHDQSTEEMGERENP